MAATNINKEQFEQVIRGEKPVLVDFWVPWCGHCRGIDPAYDRIAGETPQPIIPDVYTVGDVRTKLLRQVGTVVADGAMAVHMAEEYLAGGA